MMPGKLSLAFWMCLIFIRAAVAGEWWEEKSYTEWSLEQVDVILNNSPWTGLSAASPPISGYLVIYVPLYYQARVLTARSIREGTLRLISLGMCGDRVHIEELVGKDSVVENESECLQEFIRSHPDDLRVKGDEQYIIVGVTMKEAIWGRAPTLRTTAFDPSYQELTNADQLSNIDSSKIHEDSSLTVNNGKRVNLSSYSPPGTDRLGAKFCFPRYFPAGTPLITEKDRELVFETRINDTKIKVKFDLKKMFYQGKLEF